MSVIKQYTGSAWELIGGGGGSLLKSEYTVSGSAVTTVTFSGLDGNTDGGYLLTGYAVNPSGAAAMDYYLYANGDTTLTNYYCEYHLGSGSSNTTGNVNTSAFASAFTSSFAHFDTAIFCDGRFSYISRCVGSTGTATRIFNISGVKTSTITNLTEIAITSSVASGIGVGSVFRLYKRK